MIAISPARVELRFDIPCRSPSSSHRFADWIRFADGMSVKLHCNREALDAWWNAVSARNGGTVRREYQTVCEAFK
jgi:hypothetical protein